MKIIQSKTFKPGKAWDSLPIANINGTTVKLHWTNKPYKWHINDGQEVFVVMDGEVDMHYKEKGSTKIVRLKA